MLSNSTCTRPASRSVSAGARAAVRHVNEIDARHRLEQLAAQVQRRADAARGEVELAETGLCVGDELGEVLDRQVEIGLHHVGQPHGPGDRHAVVDEVERELLVERRVDRIVGTGEGDGVAVGRSGERELHADVAAGADPVLDDEVLTEIIGEILADQPRGDVVGAARGEAYDPAHRPGRIVLRACEARDGRQRGSARGEMQKPATTKLHGATPRNGKTLTQFMFGGQRTDL
jgi:hypothetical protein